jgi:hypothetical protein
MKILNTHNGKLWNYDGQYLLIRPYFPKERKRLYIKVHNDSKQAVLDRVAVELQNQQVYPIFLPTAFTGSSPLPS